MTNLTKSEFESYEPKTLTGCADRLKNIVDGLGLGVDDCTSAQKNAANNFQGKAADAITEQATFNIGTLQQAHDAVEELRKAYANGARTLRPPVIALREAQRAAEQNGFIIEENWQLIETQSSGMSRTMLQHYSQEVIDNAVTALDQADEQVSLDIFQAHLTLGNTPFPHFADYSSPMKEEPSPDSDDPKPNPDDSQPMDESIDAVPPPSENVTKAGSTEDYPAMNVALGSSDKIPLQDHPPGYDPNSPKSNDQQWLDYLNQFGPGQGHYLNPNGTTKDGSPAPVLPNPNAVKDPGLRALGAAGQRQGTSYAWGGGHGVKPGATKGILAPKEDDSWHFGDNKRTGLDCSGLARDAWSRGAGIDINHGNIGNTVGQYGHLSAPGGPGTPVPSDNELRPGDLIYYGDPGQSHHVAIYAGNGMVIQAHQSGEPVELSPMDLSEPHLSVRPKP